MSAEPNNTKEQSETHFSQQRTAIPFGKFESGADDIFPCNESMVGRKGARAKLIDFLTNAGTRKAILVTGRRGMGKTSFVQYCLGEYLEARIERYWHSNFGRSLYSFAWLFVISMLGGAVYLIGSQILQILLENTLDGHNHFLWLIIALLIFFLSFPFIYAGKIFAVIFKQFELAPSIFAFILVVIPSYLFVTYAPFSGSPPITLSYFMVIVAFCYFMYELFDLFICFHAIHSFYLRWGSCIYLGV